MATDTSSDSADHDWRLQADLGVSEPRHALDALLGRLGRPAVVKELEASLPHDVVLTHDGSLLFAYAADQATLATARGAIESVLARDGIQASVCVSHWDDALAQWRQTDPPPSAAEAQALQDADRDAEAIDTRTLVAKVGKEIRAEFEQSLLAWANRLGVQCSVEEHPHLLTTQVAFTITGPKRKLDEFAQALKAAEWATIRTETRVMSSPL
jgi:hypothetical protein